MSISYRFRSRSGTCRRRQSVCLCRETNADYPVLQPVKHYLLLSLVCSSPLCFSNALGSFVGCSQYTANLFIYVYILLCVTWNTFSTSLYFRSSSGPSIICFARLSLRNPKIHLYIYLLYLHQNGRSSNLHFQNIRFPFGKNLMPDKLTLFIHLYFYNVVTATYTSWENISSILEFVLKMVHWNTLTVVGRYTKKLVEGLFNP